MDIYKRLLVTDGRKDEFEARGEILRGCLVSTTNNEVSANVDFQKKSCASSMNILPEII